LMCLSKFPDLFVGDVTKFSVGYKQQFVEFLQKGVSDPILL
jgi:hypothetical protein